MTPPEEKTNSKKQNKVVENNKPKKGLFMGLRGFMFKEDSDETIKEKGLQTELKSNKQKSHSKHKKNAKKNIKENAKKNVKDNVKEKKLENIAFGKGINLVVTKTTEEIQVEVKKTNVNLSGLLTILIFIFVTILIFGVNIIFKLSYNHQVEVNESLKTQIANKQFIAEANAQMVDRLFFMQQLDEKNFSPKEVFTFFQDKFASYGEVSMIEVTNDLRFSLTGTADSYASASDLWHQLSTSSSINTLEISNVSKSNDGIINVNFEGILKYDNFLKLVEP